MYEIIRNYWLMCLKPGSETLTLGYIDEGRTYSLEKITLRNCLCLWLSNWGYREV